MNLLTLYHVTNTRLSPLDALAQYPQKLRRQLKSKNRKITINRNKVHFRVLYMKFELPKCADTD